MESNTRVSDIIVSADRKKTAYYQHFLKPYRIDYSVEENLYYEQEGFTCGFGFHRQEDYGDYTDEEKIYI